MDFGSLLQSGGAGLSDLLQNRLFLQYLSGAGGAMSAGQPVGPAINQITQKTIGAQSQAALNQQYMDMLRKMLSGEEVPEGGKVVIDSKGTKIDIPTSAGRMGTPTAPTMPGTPGAPAQGLPQMGQMGQMETINPFSPSQPGISAADLAGLGPQDVSRALAGAIGVESLKQQSITNILSTFYNPLDRPYPVTSETGETMSTREWKALPSSEREYLAYLHTAKKLGAPKEELSREFFMSLEPAEQEKFVRATMEDPALMSAAKELAKAGATKVSVGEKVAGKVAEKRALSKLKGRLYFDDPKWIDDVGKHLGSKDILNKIFTSENEALTRAEETIKFIKNKITSGKGKIVGEKWSADGNTKTWIVKYPDSDTTEEITYVFD